MLRLALLATLSLIAPLVAKSPNVLVVMTDDQGLGDFSFTGNPILKTPHFDRFARESVRLTDFHVCPMCSPTRGQLMTGLTALRNGATSVTAGRTFLRPGLKTMPEIFVQSGYRTGLFGKWHLGDLYPHRPIDKGFQESLYHLGWGMMHATPEINNPLINGRYFHNGVAKKFTGHCTDFWFDEAMKWMRQCQKDGKPFFCYIPTNAPHAPHVNLPEYPKPYQGKGPAPFFGMIAHLDKRFGDLDAFLKESGLRDDTIVIFMTDNGGTSGVRIHNAGLRAGKTTYYDGGHRVPCWIRWPNGQLGQPRDIDVPTQNTDLLPTLIDWCNLKKEGFPSVSAEEYGLYGGKSLTSMIHGSETLADRKLVVQYGQNPKKDDCCVIWKQWRLVHGKELYDIHADRAQAADRAAEHPKVVAEMKEYYDQWWKGLQSRIDDFVPNHIGAPQQPEVEITSADWEGIYADNVGYVRQATGGPNGGHWHIHVDMAGTYEFILRRWPEQTKVALGDRFEPTPEFPGNGKYEIKAFPKIAKTRLQIAGLDLSGLANPKEGAAILRAELPAGRTKMKAWFQDLDGNDLCGAFFVTIRKLP